MAASHFFIALQHCFRTAALALLDLGRLVALMARSRSALSAENLFLGKQLGAFPGAEGQTQPGPRFHAMDDGGAEPPV
jgi:hypothetical protein